MSKLVDQLKRHEGLRLKPYKCTAGKLTIGYGRNLDDKGINKDEASYMLYRDLHNVGYELNGRIPNIMDNMVIARSDILINMAFNIGVNGVLKFKKMLAALEIGDYNEAALQMMDSKWAKQVGNRAIELSEQMRTGKYK